MRCDDAPARPGGRWSLGERGAQVHTMAVGVIFEGTGVSQDRCQEGLAQISRANCAHEHDHAFLIRAKHYRAVFPHDPATHRALEQTAAPLTNTFHS
jgi:hypothetical protein